MVAMIAEIFVLVAFNFAADEMINAKARTSDSHALAMESMRCGVDSHTYHKRGKHQRMQSLGPFAGKMRTSDVR